MEPLAQLEAARLYLVTDALDRGPALTRLLDMALIGGVGIIQLRDRSLEDDELLEAAELFRAAADRHGALFLINDRPDLVGPAEADGVHVGQEDLSIAQARALAGPGKVVGLSSHSPAQLDAAEATTGSLRPDYISAGPVWETPTKPGRPGTGLDYVSYAAEHAALPWFAIGGVDASNVASVIAAGAQRIVVVRAIRDAEDPERAATALATELDHAAAGVGR